MGQSGAWGREEHIMSTGSTCAYSFSIVMKKETLLSERQTGDAIFGDVMTANLCLNLKTAKYHE
jgi:hypothetical protein